MLIWTCLDERCGESIRGERWASSVPNAECIFFIRHAIRAGMTVEEIFDLTKIKEIVDVEEELAASVA